MKSLTANIFCCNCKLYKIGFLIGFIYLIPNLIVLTCIFLNGGEYSNTTTGLGLINTLLFHCGLITDYDYILALLCAVTLLSSLLLLRGLIEVSFLPPRLYKILK